ncbi:hypothetical protein F4819DRAFT_485323 [Hypoxylon fuscum]|nr:hypothetical protein F4819DRAFT_485323 [Hypoxylon fuscum]
MTSLFELATANSVSKPLLTKFGHALPDKDSTADEKSNTRPATLQGSQKTEAGGQQAKEAKTSASGVETPTASMRKVKSGIEYFQP